MGKKENLAETAKEYATYNFLHGLTCCESVYEALLRSEAVQAPEISHASCAMCAGFGGGMGQSGLTCGALSGAVMAVGAHHGNKNLNPDSIDPAYENEPVRYNNLVREFSEKAGSALCKEITKDYQYSFVTPERKAFCTKVVELAVELGCKYIAMDKREAAALSYGFNVANQSAGEE